MRETIISGTLALLCACSGNGVSTTARATGASGLSDGTGTDVSSGSETSGPVTSSTTGEPTGGSDPTTDPSSPTTSPTTDATTDPTDATTSDTMVEPVTIVGAWVSEGADLAPILVQLVGAERIDAIFTDNTFTVTTLDNQGAETVQAGVYSSTASGVGDIFEITLEQSSPSAVTVEGIYEIDDTVQPAVMRYEVVQTLPDVGAIPPTPEGGFGSTANGSDLTQVYRRQ